MPLDIFKILFPKDTREHLATTKEKGLYHTHITNQN